MLKVQDISFGYSKSTAVLSDISFQLEAGEHLCVMGESGSGKSTLLKAIYGLLDLAQGSIFWKEQEVLGPAHHLVPGMEFFKYVPQDFDLMPYTSVSENIKKHLSRFYPEQAQERTDELLSVIEMTAFADVKVKNLSGGQQQRVAIARALAKEPELILLDEPFSQIDNFKKNSLRRKLFAFLKEKNITCIVATHDGSDALSFADRMIVIKDHRIIANDSPLQLFNAKPEHYVAALFDDVNQVNIDGVNQLLYPKDIQLVRESALEATVVRSYFKGHYWLIEVELEAKHLFVKSDAHIASGNTVYLEFSPVKN